MVTLSSIIKINALEKHMKYISYLLAILLIAPSSAVLADKKGEDERKKNKRRDKVEVIVLGDGGAQHLSTSLTGRIEFLINDNLSHLQITGGKTSYDNGLTFDMSGFIRIGSSRGESHVVCDGGPFAVYERNLVFSNAEGYFVLATPPAAESADPTNEQAAVVCFSPSSPSSGAVYVDPTSVVAGAGAFACASGGFPVRLNGMPNTVTDQNDFYSAQNFSAGIVTTPAFVIYADYLRNPEKGTDITGAIVIPPEC